MARWDRSDNWLAGIAESDHPNHVIMGNLGDLSAEMVQASFDVTYGEGLFKATNHGSVITVWSNRGFATKLRHYAQNARDRGDEARAEELEQKAIKYETP